MAEHEVMIIGGGTGGLRAATISAKSGYDTALIEPDDMGGTCLNTGCIPTKTLLHAAEIYNEMQEADEIGVRPGDTSHDFSSIMERMQNIVEKGRKGAEKSVENNDNITLYEKSASFISEDTVKAGREEITADNIVIATGASPWTPPIEGLEETGNLTNVEALALQEEPESIVMLGAGYIACEFASFYASLDIDVTIIEMKDRILNVMDEEVAQLAHQKLEELGVEIHTGLKTTEVSGENGSGVEVKTEDKEGEEQVFEGQYLMATTGRAPNTKDLGLENANVETGERGHVKIDEHLQTNNENIYAIGDVHGKAPFAHTAKREAKMVLENMLLGKDKTLDHDIIPWAAFTFPTIGGVGMNEEEAREAGHNVGVKKAKFEKTGKAKIIRKTDGFVKIVYDKDTREVLGTTIIGPDAHNLIHEFALLLNTPEPKIDYIEETVHVHPTLAEVMEELKEA